MSAEQYFVQFDQNLPVAKINIKYVRRRIREDLHPNSITCIVNLNSIYIFKNFLISFKLLPLLDCICKCLSSHASLKNPFSSALKNFIIVTKCFFVDFQFFSLFKFIFCCIVTHQHSSFRTDTWNRCKLPTRWKSPARIRTRNILAEATNVLPTELSWTNLEV